MISAADSSVLLDVLTDDPDYADRSENLLRQASGEGRIIICGSVVAEIFPALGSEREFREFLNDWQIDFVPDSLQVSLVAGDNFLHYLDRGGKGGRIVPDFLIGAHASVHADRLLARDRGYLRDYFQDLSVLAP